MSKLLKLKEWLTIPETARHLSSLFGEPVTDADVLRLGLDERIKLSVNFLHSTHARLAGLVPLHDALAQGICREIRPGVLVWGESDIPTADTILDGGQHLPQESAIRFDYDNFLRMENRVSTIIGVWDLPLIGAERVDVENRFHKLTGGPEVTVEHIDGAFIKDEDGSFAVLQESYHSPEIERDLGDSPWYEPQDHPGNYFSVDRLPEQSILVIRAAELTRFQSSLLEKPIAAQTENPAVQAEETLSPQDKRKIKGLLRIIGLMVNHRYAGDIEKPFAIARHLADKAQDLGVQPPSGDTIAKHLKAALDLIKRDRES
jgi:hypothetical protein